MRVYARMVGPRCPTLGVRERRCVSLPCSGIVIPSGCHIELWVSSPCGPCIAAAAGQPRRPARRTGLVIGL